VKRRLFNLAAAVSLIVCVALTAMWIRSAYRFDGFFSIYHDAVSGEAPNAMASIERAGPLEPKELAQQVEPAPLRELITASVDLDRVRASPMQLLIVTADLVHRTPRVFDNATVTVDALMATSAVPGAFPPVAIGDGALVDGGITARAPVLEALAAGVPLRRALVLLSYAADEAGRAL